MSIRDFIEDQHADHSQSSPKLELSDSLGVGNKQKLIENDSFNNKPENLKSHRPLKAYENNEEYQQGFITRSKLVRTPPEKWPNIFIYPRLTIKWLFFI